MSLHDDQIISVNDKKILDLDWTPTIIPRCYFKIAANSVEGKVNMFWQIFPLQ